ncbi:MAG: dienelactone hydrolase family protein [Acidobacteriota bacterium]|nr:dienelactone hydrolase family protein [Acidobacteriota bacterium]
MLRIISQTRASLMMLVLVVMAVSPVNALQLSLPASDEEARNRLNSSPRHSEWLRIESGGENINAWIVFPERSDPAPVVVVIHEIYGLTDWIRAVTDQLAADGYIAIAPDLLSGKGPKGGGMESVDRDGAVALVRSLEWNEMVSHLNDTARHAMALGAATNSIAVLGFCWGGSSSFAYAGERPDLGAAVVYYGSTPTPQVMTRIQAPVLGLYGEDDARVNRTIPSAETEMAGLDKNYQNEIYAGAGHGFLRAQGAREGANLRASEQAWPRTISFLKSALGE